MIRNEETQRIFADRFRQLTSEKHIIEQDNYALMLQKEHLESDKRQDQMIKEELLLKIDELKSESQNLRIALKAHENHQKIENIVSNRVDALNLIISRHMSGKNPTKINEIINKVIKNKKDFLDSNIKIIATLYPDFIEYLKSLGFNIEEIEAASLYAIGMNGKTVGAYFDDRRHYHLCTSMRKKFGLTEHDTNTSNYIRRLYLSYTTRSTTKSET